MGEDSEEAPRYGVSSLGQPFVSADPYARSPFRLFIYASIGLGACAATAALLRTRRRPPGEGEGVAPVDRGTRS